ncbi:MAG: hypothetical protein FIB00_12750 [Chloroflexi bacterium]|nr:hypothetical protein [Chloroflexota bacterium]PWB42634.1 MAG: hypothetical protein C3F10_12860 [Dehalococcoidia bacterium]
MRRFLPPVWVLSAALVLVGVASFAVADRQSLHWYVPEEPAPTAVPAATPVPDVVVGVSRLCELAPRWDIDKQAMGPPSSGTIRRYQQDGCAGIPDQLKLNDRIEVTVRTGTGGSYVVTVAPDSTVSVGDTWRR